MKTKIEMNINGTEEWNADNEKKRGEENYSFYSFYTIRNTGEWIMPVNLS